MCRTWRHFRDCHLPPPVKPALHVHVEEPGDRLLEPEGQAVHVAFPAPLNCPAGHASHLDLSEERTCPLAQQSPVVLQPAQQRRGQCDFQF